MTDFPDLNNRRILVIDDNLSIHDDFRKILSPASAAAAASEATAAALFGSHADAIPPTQFEVDSAYQGQEALLMVKNALDEGLPYAMAFVDVRMPPGWDGVETTRRIWEIDPDLQVVLCTAYSDYSWGEMFKKLGHSDGLLILKKPFDTVEAFQLAHALTRKWRLQQQSRRKMEDLETLVAERTRELRESEERFRGYFELGLIGMAISSPDRGWIEVNAHLCEMLGFERSELLETTWSGLTHPEDLGASLANFGRIIAGEIDGYTMNKRFVRKDGRIVDVIVSTKCVRNTDATIKFMVVLIEDITERKRLEAQIFQSQKMETVGKLAGGIAHEFNSILTAIIGQSEFLISDLPAESPLVKNATEIIIAATRAADLTRQLLAYGRKQILRPETLDLNRVITGMEGMFHHLMGGNVKTDIVTAPDLHAVTADAGQIEQVIMNMAINAHDAMPMGGRLTFETANVSIDRESIGRYPDMKPGEYVALAITDTGVGMSPAVREHVFEPFYSTKDVGQGTGLGLSTCHGIIKQSGGHISVYSEPSRGSTFKIYLPRAGREKENPDRRIDTPALPRGTETILLVEDDPALREMAATLLRRLGYVVLSAADGIEALRLKQRRDSGHIDLLFTDVVMPHMSGKELSDRIHASSPHTRTLFASAYAENAIVHHGVLDEGVALLQKPFTPAALARKLREVLDHPAPENLNPATTNTIRS